MYTSTVKKNGPVTRCGLTDTQETTAGNIPHCQRHTQNESEMMYQESWNNEEFVDKIEFKLKVVRRYHTNKGNNPSNGYHHMFIGYPVS